MAARVRPSAVLLLLALAACASTPPVAPPTAFDGAAAVAAVRAAGQVQDSELEVQPLRDPQVEDLRQQAAQLETRQDYGAAAALLDRALALQPGDAQDPAVLQERAELALLLGDAEDAARHAEKAIALGSATGPLCRRHWETVRQAAQAGVNDRVVRKGESEAQAGARVQAAAAKVRQAGEQREACTVAAPNRF